MREILFRGKRVDNGEWAFGNLFVPDDTSRPVQVLVGTDVVRISYEVIPETVGQYTGLTDWNGKKIFEGDIIDIFTENDALGVVEYKVGVVECKEGRFIVQTDSFCVNFLHNINGADVKVIGNTHDNPELLKGGDDE